MAKKKKRKQGNTAARTMAWLRKKGYTVAKVERWNPFAHIRQDLFGFIDLIGIHPDHAGVLGVQTTHENFFKDHKNKLFTDEKVAPKIRIWLQGNNRVWMFSWNKYWKEDGSHRKVWAPIVQDVKLGSGKRFYFSDVEEIKR